MNSLRISLFIAAGIALLVLGVWFGRGFNHLQMNRADEYPSATVLEVPVPLPRFSLTDHNGNLFTPHNLSRKWTFMFFGYTNCPDICPTALVDLNDIYLRLKKQGALNNTQFVFVSVDPQRDTAEQLREYVPFFNKDFIGLTGGPDSIASVARPLGIAYRRVPGKDADRDYLVDHSASFLLIDPLGRMRAIFSPPHDAQAIVTDFRKIRVKYAEECCISGDEKSETVIFDYRKEKK
jgi:protein SCO1/2